MFEVQAPFALDELRVKDRFKRRDFRSVFNNLFGTGEGSTCTRRAVVVVSHSGTIANILYSHTAKEEEEVLKPRNSSVIAIDDAGRLGLRHEGNLAECKTDEWHEYFTVPQFEQFAEGTRFGYTPPRSCLLLLVRHGIAVSNIDKAIEDGSLTREGEASVVTAACRIANLLRQHDIRAVDIFSSVYQRARQSSELLYSVLRLRQSPASRSLPCLLASCGSETEGDESWLQGGATAAGLSV